MFKFDDTLTKIVKANLQSNVVPLLLGEPGIGKSSWVEALAQQMNTKCFTLACNQLADKADLTGARLVPTGTTYKQVFYPHAVIADAIEYAESHPNETPVLFLDEINRTTPDVTSEALSIPTARRIGSQSLPKNLKVLIAGNDKGNVTSLDSASITRFVLYHCEPDVSTFINVNPNLNTSIKKVLDEHPEYIFCKTIVTKNNNDDDDDDDSNSYEDFENDEEMLQITTPRTITALSNFLNNLSPSDIMGMFTTTTINKDGENVSILQETVESHIGKTQFSMALMLELSSKITNNQLNNNSLTISKPNSFDVIKGMTTVNQICDYINQMTDNEKAELLIYMLYNTENNAVYIQELAQQINKLTGNCNKTLMNLITNDLLDEHNVNALMQTNTNIANALSVILE